MSQISTSRGWWEAKSETCELFQRTPGPATCTLKKLASIRTRPCFDIAQEASSADSEPYPTQSASSPVYPEPLLMPLCPAFRVKSQPPLLSSVPPASLHFCQDAPSPLLDATPPSFCKTLQPGPIPCPPPQQRSPVVPLPGPQPSTHPAPHLM